MTSLRQHPWVWLVLILGITAVLYASGLDGGFISDDVPMISENPRVASLAAVPDFFTRSVWENSAIGTDSKRLYRPLYLTWYAALGSVFGVEAMVYHIAHLLLHLLNAALLFWLLPRLLPGLDPVARVLSTAFFSWHPVVVEAVAWISGGTDVLLTTLLLAATACWLRHAEHGGNKSLVAGVFLLAAALLVKETAVAYLPLLWLGLWQWGVRSGRGISRAGLGLSAGVAVAFLLLRAGVLHDPAPGSEFLFNSERLLRLGEYLALAGRYLLLPWPQPFYLIHPGSSGIAQGWEWMVGLLAFAVAMLGLLRRPATRAGLLTLFAFLAPPLGLAFHEAGLFALRFLYLPALGLALTGAALLNGLPTAWRPWAGVLLVPWVVGTLAAVPGWGSERHFVDRLLQSNPRDAASYSVLGEVEAREGRADLAIEHMQRGLELADPGPRRDSLMEDLALMLGQQRRFAESTALFQQLAETPYVAHAGHTGLGNIAWMQGDLGAAERNYRQALALEPGSVNALRNLAALLTSQGLRGEAAALMDEVLRNPALPADAAAKREATAWLEANSRPRQR